MRYYVDVSSEIKCVILNCALSLWFSVNDTQFEKSKITMICNILFWPLDSLYRKPIRMC